MFPLRDVLLMPNIFKNISRDYYEETLLLFLSMKLPGAK